MYLLSVHNMGNYLMSIVLFHINLTVLFMADYTLPICFFIHFTVIYILSISLDSFLAIYD